MRNRLTPILVIGLAAALAIAAGGLPPLRPDTAESLAFLGFQPARPFDSDRLAAAEGVSFAFDFGARRLFAACATSASVTVLDLDSGHPIALLPVGDGPVSLIFDPALDRLYVLGREGVLSVIMEDDANSYRLLDSIRLHHPAQAMRLDLATHELSVSLPGRTAPIAAFAPKPTNKTPGRTP